MTSESLSTRVLVDLDGVMAEFDGEVRARLAQSHPHIIPVTPETGVPAFYTAENYAPEHQGIVWDVCNQQGFEASLPLVPYVLEGWERALDAGYTLQVCSTPRPARFAPRSKEEKIEWLDEHLVPRFGKWVVRTAVFTSDKHLVPAMANIDDKPHELMKKGAIWEHVIFDRPCNRTPSSENLIRLNGWGDPELLQKLEKAKIRYEERVARG